MNWKWINAAYPFEHSFREKRNTILTISIFTSVLIFLLQPFGIISNSGFFQVYYFLGFLIISLITLTINYFGFPYFFSDLFANNRWSVAKAFLFLVYNFLIIGFWNHIFISLVHNDIAGLVSMWELSRWIMQTLAIGLISSGFLILFRYNLLARKYLQVSQELNEHLQNQLKKHKIRASNEEIVIELEKKPISLSGENLTFFRAEGNYVAVHYHDNGNGNKKLFRNTISQVEQSLKSYPHFFRCHRSYIINLNAVESTYGNSQGLFVKTMDGAEKIPVARSKIKAFKELIDNDLFI